MHAHPRTLGVLELVRGLAGRGDHGCRQGLAQRLVERGDLVGVQPGSLGERRQARDVQDLVAVGVADPRDDGLVAQDALDLGVAGAEQRGEGVEGERVGERVGPEPRDPGHLGRVGHDVCRQALAGPRLGQVEAATGRQADPHGDRRLVGAQRGTRHLVIPAKPAGLGEVKDQVQPVAVDVDELAVPPDPGDHQAVEGLRGGGVGLEHGERSELDGGDGVVDDPLGQEVDERLDLGQLRHGLILPHPRRTDNGSGEGPTPGPAGPAGAPARARGRRQSGFWSSRPGCAATASAWAADSSTSGWWCAPASPAWNADRSRWARP